MQDFGEQGVDSTWLIDAFCGARSNFSTDCIGN